MSEAIGCLVLEIALTVYWYSEKNYLLACLFSIGIGLFIAKIGLVYRGIIL